MCFVLFVWFVGLLGCGFIFRVVRQASESIEYILLIAIDCCGDLRELPFFPMVKPVADLMKAEQWSTLLGPGRWAELFDRMPEDLRECMPPAGHSHFEDVSANPAHLQFIADSEVLGSNFAT